MESGRSIQPLFQRMQLPRHAIRGSAGSIQVAQRSGFAAKYPSQSRLSRILIIRNGNVFVHPMGKTVHRPVDAKIKLSPYSCARIMIAVQVQKEPCGNGAVCRSRFTTSPFIRMQQCKGTHANRLTAMPRSAALIASRAQLSRMLTSLNLWYEAHLCSERVG